MVEFDRKFTDHIFHHIKEMFESVCETYGQLMLALNEFSTELHNQPIADWGEYQPSIVGRPRPASTERLFFVKDRLQYDEGLKNLLSDDWSISTEPIMIQFYLNVGSDFYSEFFDSNDFCIDDNLPKLLAVDRKMHQLMILTAFAVAGRGEIPHIKGVKAGSATRKARKVSRES